MSFKVGLSCCAAPSSVPLDDVNTVAARFLNLNVRSFHDAAVEQKLDYIETASDSMEDRRSLDPSSTVVAVASAAFIIKMSDKSVN